MSLFSVVHVHIFIDLFGPAQDRSPTYPMQKTKLFEEGLLLNVQNPAVVSQASTDTTTDLSTLASVVTSLANMNKAGEAGQAGDAQTVCKS